MTPRMISGKIIRIENVGLKYSGNWYVTEAKHQYNGRQDKVVTVLSLLRNALGKTGNENTTKKSIKGQKPINNQSSPDRNKKAMPIKNSKEPRG